MDKKQAEKFCQSLLNVMRQHKVHDIAVHHGRIVAYDKDGMIMCSLVGLSWSDGLNDLTTKE